MKALMLSTPRGPVQYSDSGVGLPLVVLHGTPGGYDQGRALGRALDKDSGVRIISISRPGYLGTPLTSGASPEQQGHLVGAVLEELGIDRAVVAGISGGGMAALWAAALQSERIAGLILLEALVAAQDIALSKVSRFLLKRRLIARTALTAPVQRYLARGLGPESHPDSDTRAVIRLMTAASFPFAAREEGTRNDEFYAATFTAPDPKTLNLPTLAIHGLEDRTVPIEPIRDLIASIQNGHLIELPDADHTSTIPNAAVREEVPKFLRETLSGTRG